MLKLYCKLKSLQRGFNNMNKKILENIFKKETFINGMKATINDLLWLFQNILLGKDFIEKVREYKTKVFVYTI